EMRKDLPVYLYDKTGVLSLRAARRLRKNGFEKISWLKGGYDNWSGKIKKSPTNY
ncbi:sulfurtransferase, partial [Lacticaseibacillus rhamnosus]